MSNQTVQVTPEVETALKYLETYDNGGKRSALLPLDTAASRAEGNARNLIEHRLLALLKPTISGTAKQYICGKLAMLGTAVSVPALVRLLGDAKVAADARTALECMPDDAAAKALLAELPRLEGIQRAGVISSLGVRRYRPASRALRRDLRHADAAVQKAARTALRRIEQS